MKDDLGDTLRESAVRKITQEVICGDCLEYMKTLPDKSFDLVLTDPPYGTTGIDWDVVVPFDKLWSELARVGKDDCVFVLFSSQPFTTDLINSKRGWFRYEWIWEKDRPSGIALSAYRPMKYHENIIVFSKETPRYFPIFWKGDKDHRSGRRVGLSNAKSQPNMEVKHKRENDGEKYPPSVIFCNKVNNTLNNHPTEKPTELLSYLIQTYSKESDTILDPFLGSGTTLVACKQLNRNGVGVEISAEYCDIAKKRLEQSTLL